MDHRAPSSGDALPELTDAGRDPYRRRVLEALERAVIDVPEFADLMRLIGEATSSGQLAAITADLDDHAVPGSMPTPSMPTPNTRAPSTPAPSMPTPSTAAWARTSSSESPTSSGAHGPGRRDDGPDPIDLARMLRGPGRAPSAGPRYVTLVVVVVFLVVLVFVGALLVGHVRRTGSGAGGSRTPTLHLAASDGAAVLAMPMAGRA